MFQVLLGWLFKQTAFPRIQERLEYISDEMIENSCPLRSSFHDCLPIYNGVVIPRPNFEAVAVTRGDVPDNVDFFVIELGSLKLVNEPLQLFSGVCAVQ